MSTKYSNTTIFDANAEKLKNTPHKKCVGIVTPREFIQSNPTRSSINIEHYYHALIEAGYEALLICPSGSECSDTVNWISAPVERYKEASFWRAQGIDAAIFFTWLGYVDETKAMKEAGIYVVARADATGTNSVRVFPRENFAYFVESKKNLLERLQQTKNWIDCFLRLYRKQDAVLLGSIREANITAIETMQARNNIVKILSYYGEEALVEKVIVCPHLLSQDILTAPVASEKERDGIVAIGRWDDWQKDAPLLRATLDVYLQSFPDTRVILIGNAGPEVFAPLVAKYPSIICTGAIPRADITSYVQKSQILLLTSHWESFHIAAHEALCSGCTVVGPDVLPMSDICEAGDFGSKVPSRAPHLLAEAIEIESQKWKKGERDAEYIAQFWRDRLGSVAIVQHMLESCGKVIKN